MNRNAAAALSMLAATGMAMGAERDVKFSSFDIANGVIELYNFGSTPQDLSGWRFCSQNSTVVLRYSSAGGFNGMSIGAGESLFVHLNNDAPADPDRINYSALGGVLAPLDGVAMSWSIYFPDPDTGSVSFGNGNLMADFLQFSLNGANNNTANVRTDEAVDGGVWSAITDWIAITEFSESIDLIDTASTRNDPSDFQVNEPCIADFAEPFGELNFFDIAAFLTAYNAMDASADLAPPFGMWNFFDVSAFLTAYNAGCP